MKKAMLFCMAFVLMASFVFAEGSPDSASAGMLKVGMVTDAGTIDDKSFNQGTWEGILKASDEGLVSAKYLKPTGTTEADYTKEIGNLVDAGYMFIVTPGYKFQTAIYYAQEKYSDAKFVLIDAEPASADFETYTAPNTVSVYFAEHESGFLAGLATALQLKTGEAGYIGGMEIPPVQKFNWGFQQGLMYANENFGTDVQISAANVVYQGSFDNVAAGQQLAAGMFDQGVDVIFCAAGGVGVGAINEAKARAKNGEEVWIVGVDKDQYSEGIYSGDKSIMLTSAMKYVDAASYEMIKAELRGEFPGGQVFMLDATNGGIGIPPVNPNLDAAVESKVADVVEMIKSGAVMVDSMQGSLIK